MNFHGAQMSTGDLAALQSLAHSVARPGMVAFELGSYTGCSTITLLREVAAVNGMLYAVDWFKGNVGLTAGINRVYETQDVLSVFRANVKESGQGDHLSVLVGTGLDVAAIVKDGVADLVFIDANHRYHDMIQDIPAWRPKVRAGGILCGHDYECPMSACDPNRVTQYCEEDYVDGKHYGVIRAVSEMFPGVQRTATIWHVRL